jgi:membrane protein
MSTDDWAGDDVGNHRAVTVAVIRAAIRHRLVGHAAEMSFFAVLALVPATVTVGAAMGLAARIAGPEVAFREQDAAIGVIRLLIGPGLGDSVIEPFVRAQLSQKNGGLALGGLLVTWWLFSHLFTATAHALDTTYGVADRRPTPVRRLISLGYALAAIVAVTVALAVMGAVPLGVQQRRDGSTLIAVLELAWTAGRWPLLVILLVLCLTCLYRYSPNVHHSLGECLPGALLGALLWVAVSVAFRIYLGFGLGAPTGVASDDPEVVLIGRAVGAVVATSFWIYFASIAVLMGGELNAELINRASVRSPAPVAREASVPLPEPPRPSQRQT